MTLNTISAEHSIQAETHVNYDGASLADHWEPRAKQC